MVAIKFSPGFGKFTYRLTLTGFIILAAFSFGSFFYIHVKASSNHQIELKSLSSILEDVTISDIDLKIQNKTITLQSEEIESWFEPYVREYSGKEDIRISSEGLYDYLTLLALTINLEPVNAKIEFEGNRAREFRVAVDGIRLNREDSARTIIKAIKNGDIVAELPVEKVEPLITIDKINDLGIKTLLAKGESDFSGSPTSRIHNIAIGAAKYNGMIVKPGETFSFNDNLGPVDEQSGYRSELVIKGGQLVYEFGGGICQVSTTLFRAAIFAGLPITERRPHSFPVRYYDPQGLDATIYPGVVDLKFTNDTPGHLLIQTKITGNRLIFEIYGTKDDRSIVVDGPYQYDQKANGALKAYFTRTISYEDGTSTERRFNSNYNAPVPLASNPLE